MTVSVAVDNSIDTWVDGVHKGYYAGWGGGATYTVPDDSVIVALKAHNSGGPMMFVVSASNGVAGNRDNVKCRTSDPGNDRELR